MNASPALPAADRLDPATAPWLADPALRQIFTVIAAGGGEARAVGGAVRDTLLGRVVEDIDLAVTLPPDVVSRLLAAAGIKVVPTGIQHGTVTAVIDGRGFELTTLRRDVATDGRRARVAYTDDWRADAARRDFTLNALYVDAEGRLYDYFHGRADLAAGHLRFIGEAAARIKEDVLRILRFFRFYAWIGQGVADGAALAACRELAPLIPQLSAERVWRELAKLLAAPDPLPALQLMREAQVLAQVLPEGTNLVRLAAMLAAERDNHFTIVPLARLAALLPPVPSVAASVAARLKLSGRTAEALVALIAVPVLLEDKLADIPAIRQAIYTHGLRAVRDALPLAAGLQPAVDLQPALTAIAAWEQPRFPLQGDDLLKLGLAAGPGMGTILQAVEAWWIAQDFRPGREACLAEAQLRMTAA